ncbi:PilZ domain-containing protein [Pseudomonadota bacterium]|nr:PilZ domain-containing protein [Pseudomonadota bacterium]
MTPEKKTIESRRHERIKHVANIRVMTQPEHEYTLEMRDFSESGLYIITDDTSIVEIKNIVEVQTLEIEDAPIITSKVIRIDKLGFALEFILD